MAGLDMTSFAAALKQHYMALTVKNLVYPTNPLYALMPKYEKFGGSNMPIPIIYGNPQGRSATFSNALAQKTASRIKAFTITRVRDYGLANIDNETMEASENDADAFMEAATTEIDGAFQSVTRSLSGAMYGNGSGILGYVSAGYTTGNSIDLSYLGDIVNFEGGMTVVAWDNVSGSVRAGSTTIATINRAAGSMTLTNAAGITSLTAGDSLLVAGDFNAKVSGLAAWIPYTAPSATTFFGVDRTADSTRLSGQRKDISALPIEEGLVDLIATVCQEGGRPNLGVMNFINYAALEKALGSKVQYVNIKDSEAIIGFEGIKVQGQKGPVSIIPDQNCPGQYTWVLQTDMWKLASLGMAPKLLKSDGLEFLRVSSEDAVEVRTGYYAQMACHAPGFNGIGKLS